MALKVVLESKGRSVLEVPTYPLSSSSLNQFSPTSTTKNPLQHTAHLCFRWLLTKRSTAFWYWTLPLSYWQHSCSCRWNVGSWKASIKSLEKRTPSYRFLESNIFNSDKRQQTRPNTTTENSWKNRVMIIGSQERSTCFVDICLCELTHIWWSSSRTCCRVIIHYRAIRYGKVLMKSLPTDTIIFNSKFA